MTLELAPQSGLDPAGERLVFRVAQECLNNRAACLSGYVHLMLEQAPGAAVLEIIDDGVGFDAAAALAHPAQGHFGLRVLGDVASDAAAELRVSSAPGSGTAWRLRVPLP